MLPKMRSLVPDDVHIDLAFDQSIYVKARSRAWSPRPPRRGSDRLMVLLFLRDWRSALIVVLTIPFSLLAAVVGLRLVGQTVNIMTSAVSRSRSGSRRRSYRRNREHPSHLETTPQASRASSTPCRSHRASLLAMLCVIAVFIPRSSWSALDVRCSAAGARRRLLDDRVIPPVKHARPYWRSGCSQPTARRAEAGFLGRLQERYGHLAADIVRLRCGRSGLRRSVHSVLLLVGRLGTELFPS